MAKIEDMERLWARRLYDPKEFKKRRLLSVYLMVGFGLVAVASLGLFLTPLPTAFSTAVLGLSLIGLVIGVTIADQTQPATTKAYEHLRSGLPQECSDYIERVREGGRDWLSGLEALTLAGVKYKTEKAEAKTCKMEYEEHIIEEVMTSSSKEPE